MMDAGKRWLPAEEKMALAFDTGNTFEARAGTAGG